METIRYQTKTVGPNSIKKLNHCKTCEQPKVRKPIQTFQPMLIRQRVKLCLSLIKYNNIITDDEWRYSSTHSKPQLYMGMSGQLHVPATSPPGKTYQYLLNRKLGGHKHQHEHCRDEKNLCLCHELNPTSSIVKLIAFSLH